jgi:SAM-dependent methyltransferase
MTVQALYQTAAQAFRAGDYEAAVNALRQIFDLNPDFQEAEAARYVAAFSAADRGRFWSAPQGLFSDTSDLRSTFETIYDRGVWGGGSGAGSDLRNTVVYVAYVQHLMERFDARSIVDLGCGDWRFSKHLKFGDRRYLGVDIVASVIAANEAAYGSGTIRFERADVTAFAIPECDLLLCKDVLQHVSNANVRVILERSRAARVAVFTNDYHPANEDCPNGSTRPLDITAAPFSVPAKPRLVFSGKVTFLVTRAAAEPSAVRQDT